MSILSTEWGLFMTKTTSQGEVQIQHTKIVLNNWSTAITSFPQYNCYISGDFTPPETRSLTSFS